MGMMCCMYFWVERRTMCTFGGIGVIALLGGNVPPGRKSLFRPDGSLGDVE